MAANGDNTKAAAPADVAAPILANSSCASAIGAPAIAYATARASTTDARAIAAAGSQAVAAARPAFDRMCVRASDTPVKYTLPIVSMSHIAMPARTRV